jgi:hypothetical protein
MPLRHRNSIPVIGIYAKMLEILTAFPIIVDKIGHNPKTN